MNDEALDSLKEELLAMLLEESEESNARQDLPLIPVARDGEIPLSFSQQRQWFLDQFEPGNPLYNIPAAVRLVGRLDVDALARGVNEVLRRHESLRTTFSSLNGLPHQVIAPTLELGLEPVDLSALGAIEREATVKTLARREAGKAFDLTSGPLIRVALLRLAAEEHIFMLTVHHIVSDGWSMGVLFQEIVTLYAAYSQGHASPLPELTVQYADFAIWQKQTLSGEVLQEHLSYWKTKLDGAPDLLNLPTDRPRPPVQSHRGASHELLVPQAILQRLDAISASSQATLFMTLNAAFAILLSRYARQDDICIGTFIANRNRVETEALIGFFVNTLVLRIQVDQQAGFDTLLRQVRETTLDAYAHQDLPFEHLLDVLKPVRSMSYTPLFQAMLVLHNTPVGNVELPELRFEPIHASDTSSNVDLMLECSESGGHLICQFEYNTDLFDASTIARMAGHFQSLLEAIVADQRAHAGEMLMYSEAERLRLLAWSNEVPQPQEGCIVKLFEAQVEKSPDALAIIGEQQQLSYREFNTRCNRLAHTLCDMGVGPDCLVGICMERSLDMLVAIMAVLKAGGAYVPLDPSYPQERLAYMLDDALPTLVLTQQSLAIRIPVGAIRLLCIDTNTSSIEEGRSDNLPFNAVGDNLAYVIYTSGSSGKPKGVLNLRRNLAHHSIAHAAQCRLQGNDRVLQFASLNFDASIEEIFPALISGAAVVLRPSELLNAGAAFAAWLEQYAISILDLPTAFWHEWTDNLAQDDVALPACLRLLIVGGEKAQSLQLSRWLVLAGAERVRWLNTYGPTETTVSTSTFETDVRGHDSTRDIPIGRPIVGSQLYLLDAFFNPVPVGVAGELYVGGHGLARGYLGRPDLTAEQFIPDPYSSDAGARLYRTGDLARYREDGNIEYVGRIDDQVKVRGFRIELGEIEAALRSLPYIRDAVVDAREDSLGGKTLIAYLIKAPECAEPDVESLRRELHGFLPAYMLPNHYCYLEQFPKNASGKINRKALPAIDIARTEIGYVAPRTPTEQAMAAMWAHVLKVDKVGIHDNFFTLGGHSLLAVSLLEHMRRAGLRVDIRDFFAAPTVASLALVVNSAAPEVVVPPNMIPQECEVITPEMLTLVQLTSEEIARVAANVVGGAANIQDIYPLAPLQEGILFHHLLGQRGDLYLMPSLVSFDSRNKLDRFMPALQAVVDRHDILRTSVIWDATAEPLQVVWRNAPVQIEEIELGPVNDAQQALLARYDPEHYRIDLKHAPLLRGFVTQDRNDGRWLLLILAHHIICDHTTGEILLEEIQAILTGHREHLPPPSPFRNFVAQARLGVSQAEHEAFFKEMLADVDEPTLPFGLRDVQGSGAHIDIARRMIDSKLAAQLRKQARGLGVSIASIMHLAWAMVLAKASGRSDVVFGTLLIGRVDSGAAAHRVLGMFINTLPLRIRIGSTGAAQCVQETHQVLTQLLHHEHASLALAQRASGVVAPTPLFSAILNYRHTQTNIAGAEPSHPDLSGTQLVSGKEFTNYPFYLSVDDFGDQFELEAQTNDSIQAQRVCDYMHTALANLSAALESTPEKAAAFIDVIPAHERNQMLRAWNEPVQGYRSNKLFHQLFEDQVAQTPDAAAVIQGERALSYAELNAAANRLAGYLRSAGMGPDMLAGILMERSPEMMISLLGVLKSGGAYLPLDPDHPVERLSYMLHDAEPTLILTQAHLRHRIPADVTKPICMLDVDAEAHVFASHSDKNLGNCALPANLAYVIYTSGSTGKPKGAQIVHGGLAHYLNWCRTAYPMTREQGAFMQLPLVFDAAVTPLFLPLLAGKSVHLPPVVDNSKLFDFLAQPHDLSMLKITPAHIDLIAFAAENQVPATTIATTVIGGEALTAAQVNTWLRLFPGTTIVNEYGPTETVVGCCVQTLISPVDDHAVIPIGRPIDDTQLYILDEGFDCVPIGAIGELYIAGNGLARGYLKRPDLTAERFIPNPFVTVPGARMYRTGDLARYRVDGTIEYLGRTDNQVKVRGFRIELGEIEAAMTALPNVREATVLAVPGAVGDKRLVAYAVFSGVAEVDALSAALLGTLPEYMVPSHVVVLDTMPLTSNGKVDRKTLSDLWLESGQSGEIVEYVAPVTLTEQALASIFAEVLGRERIGMHDNFFLLGGHSLSAIQVLFRIRAVMRIDLPLRTLFASPTVESLARDMESLHNNQRATFSPDIVPVERGASHPLSFAQKRFWFLDQYQPGSAFYSLPLAMRISGDFDSGIIEKVFNMLAERHEPLRTVFVQENGIPRQVVLPALEFHLNVEDFSGLGSQERERGIKEKILQEAGKPFDLAHGPLIRIGLLKEAANEHIFLLTLHHIMYDGWSIGLLLEEVTELYAALRKGEPSPLAPLPIQYVDYTNWEQQRYGGEALREHLDFWRSKLAGAPELLALPTDRPRPPVLTHHGASYHHVLDAGLTKRLNALALKYNGSLFMLLTTAFNILLHRLSGQDDLCIGALSANRPPQTESLIGIFVNIITLRSVIDGNERFSDFFRRSIENLLTSYERQIPFELVLTHFTENRNASYMPFVQVALNFHNESDRRVDRGMTSGQRGADFHISGLDANTITRANFEIQIEMSVIDDCLQISYEYNTDLFDANTILQWNSYFGVLLEGICNNPEQLVGDLPFLPHADRHRLLETWNDNARDYPRDTCIHELFEAQVLRTPNDIALVFNEQELSYAELNARANRLAHHLISLGVGPDVLVGICIERSLEMVVGLLAVLKAGGAYVPLDPAYPQDRLAYMVTDSRPAVLLTQECLLRVLPSEGVAVFCVDTGFASLDHYPSSNPVVAVLPMHLIYVIYTSGSTGRPKGAAVQQRGFMNLLAWYLEAFDFDAYDKVLLISSFSFDLTQKNIFAVLSVGGQLHLPGESYSPVAMDAYIQQHGISYLNCAPSAFYPLLPYEQKRGASQLKQVFLGGEPIQSPLLCDTYGTFAEAAPIFHNTYGPTEASDVVSSCTWRVDSEIDTIPIGKPISNTQIYVLDAHYQPVPVGVVGEVHIAGDGLARGYLHRPHLTAEKFVPNPFSAKPGQRMYKTGDLARFLPDGNIEYLGRIDNQVKIRGFRIELGEIESALIGLPEIREAVVLAREDVAGDKRLVAYLVWQDNAREIAPGELRAALLQSLPDYMIPAHFVALAQLPLSPNGKVDRKALPAPDMLRGKLGYVEPGTELENQLALIWAEVLRLDRVGIHDNFFEVGGHSLLATQVASRIHELLGRDLSVRELFEAPTVSELALRLSMLSGNVRRSPIEPVSRSETLPLSFAQQRLWFLQELEGPSPTFNMPQAMRVRGPLDVAALEAGLQVIVQRHEILRTRFVVKNGEPCMVVDDYAPVSLPVRGADEEQIEALSAEHARHVFDLATGPLLIADVVRLATDEHVLLVNMHHIVSDGWSLNILVQEWVALYESLVRKQLISLPPLPLQYADYAWWQRQHLGDKALASQLDYWTKQLDGAPELLNLPTDFPRPPVQRFVGDGEVLILSPEVSQRAHELSRLTGSSLFMTLISVFTLLMSRYSGEEDVLIGTVSSNRNRRELEGLIGMFLGNLVLRIDLSGQPSFRELLTRIRKTALDAYTNSDIPFERIVDALPLQRDLSRNPLFQVFFNMLNLPEGTNQLSELEIEGLNDTEFHSKFDMTLYVRDTSFGIVLSLVYNSSLFSAERMQEMLRQYSLLLEQAVGRPDACIDDFVMLTAQSKPVLPDPTLPLGDGWQGSVPNLFVATCMRNPDAVAVVSHERSWTYRELQDYSQRVSCYLQERGIGKSDIVAIDADRNAVVVAAIMGALMSGAAYMMLDPAYPVEHLKACLEAAPAKAWIQVAPGLHSEERRAVIATVPVLLDLSDIDSDGFLEKHAGQAATLVPLTADDIAVISFTSGSTGKPKAVEGRHGPLTHFLPWLQSNFSLGEDDRYSMLSGLAHDPLQRDIFTALCTGASLHIPHPRMIHSTTLAGWMHEHGVTVSHLTPAMSQVLADAPEGLALPSLRRVFLVGDILTRRDVKRLQHLAPAVNIVNYYGSTETQRSVSYYDVAAETPAQALREVIPLGRGIGDVQLLVLNRTGRQAGIGEHGEVYMRSSHMARGYRGDTELTRQRFLTNPFGADDDDHADRLYRTGDLGRYLPDGMVECLGRADTQVKLRGFRVELGHIESLLGQHEQVREAIVVIRNSSVGEKLLVAYVVPVNEPPAITDLRDYLRRQLPDYMQPTFFVFLEKLPLTPNGKVNRGALPAPALLDSETAYVAPRNSVEEALVAIWQELLGLDRVGIHDNFFSLGGHSLLAIKLMARIEKHFGVRLPVSQVFLAPSIGLMAESISTKDQHRLIVPMRQQGEGAPLFLIHPAGGEIFAYTDLVSNLNAGYPIYAIQSAAVAGVDLTPYDIDTVCAAYVNEMLALQKSGAFHLGGWSLGGTLALRCAHMLEQLGHVVNWVLLLDTVYRDGRVTEPMSLATHIENYLDFADEDVQALYGDDGLYLQQRIRAYVTDYGYERLIQMLYKEPEVLEKELGFGRAAQAFFMREYTVTRDNIYLASGFKPNLLAAPIHTFWAEQTLLEGVDGTAWQPFTSAAERGAMHVLPGRHISFAFGENAVEIAQIVNSLMEGVE